MVGVEGKPPSKDLKFRIVVIVGIAVISGYILWFFVLPLVGRYERLDVLRYYWAKNNRGEIRLLVVDMDNNGTQDLIVSEIWVDGVRLENDSWEGWFGITVRPLYGETFYVAPKDFLFEMGRDYNLTVVASSGRQYSFVLNVNENNTRTENLKITGVYFYHVPPVTGGEVIGVEVQDLGGTDIIIREALINGSLYTVSPRFDLWSGHSFDGFEIGFPWKKGENYTVTIETIAGTTANYTATAD